MVKIYSVAVKTLRVHFDVSSSGANTKFSSVQTFCFFIQSDWNDGKVLSEMIRSLGGSAAAPEKLRSDPAYWEQNQYQAVEAGKRLGERIFDHFSGQK